MQHGSERIGSLAIGLLYEVGVDTKCRRCIRMAQTATDCPNWHAGSQKAGGRKVAKVM
jgi:hypothetical protein